MIVILLREEGEMAKKIIPFPKIKHLLRCSKCHSNDFHIWLYETDPFSILCYEYYPCNPDIFEKTYELVEDNPRPKENEAKET